MVEEAYTVIFYTSANKDLAGIKRYWEKVLETPADDFMAEVYHKAKALEDFPFAHHLPSDDYLRNKGYRMLPVRNYYIFYKVIENEVQIHRVLYSKMDFSKIL